MHIIVIAWIYVVFMMSITEASVIGGIMTFVLYGLLPLSIILYLLRTNHRRRKRKQGRAEQAGEDSDSPPAPGG
jgi:bacteriorhodopsin